LAKVLQVPEIIEDADEGATERMTFTAEELEILESVTEEDSEPTIPTEIDGIHVNTNPKAKEITEIIDLRRIGPHRQTFYLAKASDGKYYWFHSLYTNHNWQLRKLIGDYRHKSRSEAAQRKTHSVKKLRNGRRIRM
jgi:hypothetical protein